MDDGTGQRQALALAGSLLACPLCGGPLGWGPDWIRCESCDARYPIEDGIPRLAVQGASETWGAPQCGAQSHAYQSEFRCVDQAASYNLQFRRRILKRGVTGRESRLLERHLRRVGRSRVVLELPCGGGRLSPAVARHADCLIEADIAEGQVLYGRRSSTVAVPQLWITASAFHVPLRDGSVDGVVCVRLAHHLPTALEVERLFGELMRVSRRFLVVSFFDRHSLKNLTWRMRHPFRRRIKPTLARADVARLARAAGGRLLATERLSRFGSGHCYALIVKDGC